MKRKDEIIMWDDIPFSLHKIEKDSIEQIRKDAFKLFTEYLEEKNRPHFTSVYESLRDIHIDSIFLMGLLQIIFRLERIENE